MTAGPVLNQFNTQLAIASGNIGEVEASVTAAREGAQDIRWAVGTFGRIENKADEVAKILGGFADVLDLLGKVGPLKTVMRPLESVMKDLERAVEKVEAKAKKIDESELVQDLKTGINNAIGRIAELEEDVGETRAQFDERIAPVQQTVDALNTAGSFVDVSIVANGVDSLVTAPNAAATRVNTLFGVETDETSVAGKLAAFRDAVDGNPLRTAQQMEADLCAIIDELGFLSKPFDILDRALSPVRWALDASDFVFNTVVAPILDPILDAIGVNKLFDGIRDKLSKLLPDINVLDAFDINGVLPELNAQLLPTVDLGDPLGLTRVDLGEFLGLTSATGLDGLLEKAAQAINPSNFSGDAFVVGSDGNDLLGDLAASVRQVLSGGAGIDFLQGASAFADIFSGGAGDDVIDGGADESSGDMVIFSGNISEYLIEFAKDATETTGDIIISHIAPLAGIVGDGIDRVRNVETFVFNGLEINAATLRNGLQVLNPADVASQGLSFDVTPYEEGVTERGFLIATGAVAASSTQGLTLNGDDGDDHLIGTVNADALFGGLGNDILDGGPNKDGVFDSFNGGGGLDEVTFAASVREEGEQIDIGAGDRGGSILPPGPALTSIERVKGSDFDDIIFGREIQNLDGDPATPYVERLAGGDGSDIIRGFGGDDRLEGNEGADILIGDGGANQYLGGTGNDVMILDATSAQQQVDGGEGFDTLIYGGITSIVSTFENGTDGWTVTTGTFGQETTGGQTGGLGHLRHIDNAQGETDFFYAPQKFLGDQSEMLGGRISFDLQVDAVSSYSLGVALVGGANGSTRIEADIDIFRDLGWQSFDIALNASGSWRIPAGSTNGAGSFATDADIADVLANLTEIEVLADRVNGFETTRLDNFVLSSLPIAPGIISDFEDQGFGTTDGWTLAYKGENADFDTIQELPALPTVKSVLGNAGSWIESVDGSGATWFSAPDKFLGDQSDMLYGRIELGIRQVTGTTLDKGVGQDEIALVGNGMTLVADIILPTDDGLWNRKGLDLDPWLWFTQGQRHTPATEAELLSVLSNLEAIYVRGEYRYGADTVGLDEFRLAPASDALSAKALEFAQATLDDVPAAQLQGRIEVDVEGGTVKRYDASDALIATDTFSGVEQIIGGDQADDFVAELSDPGASIILHGEGGDDSFTLGTGQQIVKAGAGDDTVTLTTARFDGLERFDGGDGTDTLDLSQVAEARWRIDRSGELWGGDWTLSDEELLSTRSADAPNFERLLLGEYDDYSSMRAVFVDAGGGNDYINAGTMAGQLVLAGDGDDLVVSFNTEGGRIELGLGNDTAMVKGGQDGAVMEIIGGPADATAPDGTPLAEDDVFLVGTGRVDVTGGDGQDMVSFGEPLNNSQSAITLDLSNNAANAGGAANFTQTGVENASGGASGDTIFGDAGSNLLIGGDGDDFVQGEGSGVAPGTGAGDVLYGNAGDDRLRGLDGDDLLHGGTGANALEGGAGSDTASYSFAQIDAVGVAGVEQSYDANLLSSVVADLGVLGGGTAVRTRVLHQDDFEDGVSGFTATWNSALDFNDTGTLPGQGTFFGPVSQASVPENQKSFDLGPDHSGPITVAFDFIEIDDWNGTGLQVATPEGFVSIRFTNGTPEATSGTASGVTWTVSPLPGGGSDLGYGSAAEHLHRVTLTFTPQDRFITLGFGANFSGSGTAADDDRVGIDNLIITGLSETDTLSDIENLVGGSFDDSLTGDVLANALNGGDGDDVLRGLGGDDVLLGGAGADVVDGGVGDDTVVAGRGSDDGRGDQYDGGDGVDTLDYSGAEGALLIGAGTVTSSYLVENPVWADTGTNEARLFDGNYYSAGDIAQARNPALANGADDFYRDLSGIADPESLITFVSDSVRSTDTFQNFEQVLGSAFGDVIDDGGVLGVVIDGGLGDDVLILRDATTAAQRSGGEGQDTVSYEHLTGPVTATLGANGSVTATGPGSVARLEVLDGFENLTGSAFGDTLTGNDEGNTLIGGAGDDVLDGGAGSDTASYANAAGGVTARLGVVADVGSGEGIDSFVNIENLTGSDFADSLTGDTGGNALMGGLGNDTLIGLGGDDMLLGGDGDDKLFGGPGTDQLFGEAGNDLLIGGSGDDELDGGDGDDRLTGNGGNDRFDGGAGNDIARGDLGDDVILGGDGDDILSGQGGFDRMEGGAGADKLSGGAQADTLLGGDGDDDMEGGGGHDELHGGLGNDNLRGNTGDDRVLGEEGDDVLNGASGDDVLNGGAGVDLIDGGSGDDLIYGEDGNDILDGDSGNDRVYGGDGDDLVDGDGGNDEVFGNLGNDTLSGGLGNDRVLGGFGNDAIDGGDGNDALFGQWGEDVLTAGAGTDLLSGGDTLGERDVFVFGLSSQGHGGFNAITDFENGVDQLDLTGFGFTDFDTDIAPLASARDNGTSTAIVLETGYVIKIDGLSLAEFDATDVLL